MYFIIRHSLSHIYCLYNNFQLLYSSYVPSTIFQLLFRLLYSIRHGFRLLFYSLFLVFSFCCFIWHSFFYCNSNSSLFLLQYSVCHNFLLCILWGLTFAIVHLYSIRQGFLLYSVCNCVHPSKFPSCLFHRHCIFSFFIIYACCIPFVMNLVWCFQFVILCFLSSIYHDFCLLCAICHAFRLQYSHL